MQIPIANLIAALERISIPNSRCKCLCRCFIVPFRQQSFALLVLRFFSLRRCIAVIASRLICHCCTVVVARCKQYLAFAILHPFCPIFLSNGLIICCRSVVVARRNHRFALGILRFLRPAICLNREIVRRRSIVIASRYHRFAFGVLCFLCPAIRLNRKIVCRRAVVIARHYQTFALLVLRFFSFRRCVAVIASCLIRCYCAVVIAHRYQTFALLVLCSFSFRRCVAVIASCLIRCYCAVVILGRQQLFTFLIRRLFCHCLCIGIIFQRFKRGFRFIKLPVGKLLLAFLIYGFFRHFLCVSIIFQRFKRRFCVIILSLGQKRRCRRISVFKPCRLVCAILVFAQIGILGISSRVPPIRFRLHRQLIAALRNRLFRRRIVRQPPKRIQCRLILALTHFILRIRIYHVFHPNRTVAVPAPCKRLKQLVCRVVSFKLKSFLRIIVNLLLHLVFISRIRFPKQRDHCAAIAIPLNLNLAVRKITIKNQIRNSRDAFGTVFERCNRAIQCICAFIFLFCFILLRLIVNRKHFAIRKIPQRGQRADS